MDPRDVAFENARGMRLAGIEHHPDAVAHDAEAEAPAVVLAHSFTGYKEVPHLAALAEELASQGFVALRFDFSDCIGESDGSCEDMKLTSQIADLRDAVTWLEAQGEVDEDRIGAAGHSLGGLTCIMAAAEDDRIRALVPVAAPTGAEGEHLFQGKELERWREMGHTHFPTRKRGEVKIGWGFYEDLQRYDAVEALPDVHAPVRFVHGSADDIVPLENSERMHAAANEPKDLHVVEGADHLFRREAHEAEMVNAVAGWLERHV